jgi:hypothetical protein
LHRKLADLAWGHTVYHYLCRPQPSRIVQILEGRTVPFH